MPSAEVHHMGYNEWLAEKLKEDPWLKCLLDEDPWQIAFHNAYQAVQRQVQSRHVPLATDPVQDPH